MELNDIFLEAYLSVAERYHALMVSRDTGVLCQAGAELARWVLNTDVAWCAELVGNELVISGYTGLRGPEMARSWRLPLGSGIGGWVAQEGRVAVIRDYLHDPRRLSPVKSIIDSEELRSGIVAPLRDGVHGDHVLGVVYVADRQLREFNTSEVQVTASLACDIGAALTKVRQERENQLCLSHLAQQLSKAERSLEVIGRITEMLANNSDLRAAMEIAVAHLGSEYFPIELSLLDEVGHELINVYSKNEVEDSTDLAEAVTEKLYSLVAGRRRLGLLRVKLGAELDELHAAVVKQLASLFVLELLHQRSSLDVELQLHSSVLDDLLKGNINEKDAVARAALIGLNLHSPHFVAAVGGYVGSHTGIPPVLTKPVVEAVASAAQRHYPHPLITVHDGVAYIVLESSDRLYQESTVTLETLVRTASSLAGGMGLSAGVGRLCLSPTDFAESARDALLALEVARTQPHENKVVNTEDLGSYAVLAHSISSKVLESLHDKVLAPLIQADKRGHDYLTTLNTYLARNLHLKETAAVLHVHVNTLRYRLRKIEELIGMDLRSSEDRFLLELALHVDKVRRSTISLDR